MTKIKRATNKQELLGILQLQRQNLKENVSLEERQAEGFVTVKHDLKLLELMNDYERQIIAVDAGKVVAYALVMVKELSNHIPVLKPMFDMFSQINYKGKNLDDYHYYVMGQICIAKAYRGKGLVKALYAKHEAELAANYDFCLTEVSKSNGRSMRAHEKCGFEIIHRFVDQTDTWNVLLLNWGNYSNQ